MKIIITNWSINGLISVFTKTFPDKVRTCLRTLTNGTKHIWSYGVFGFAFVLQSISANLCFIILIFDISPERSPISYYSIKNRMYSLLEFLFINLLIVAASDYVKISNFHNFT